MEHQAPIPQYQFGVFTVDIRGGELRKHGTRVKLQERPFQVLLALVEKPGEIVTRKELRQRLWPDGTFVDFDHSLSSAINKLRSALNDSASHPRYIETAGRGYRFIYPVSVAAPELSPQTIPLLKPAATRTRRGLLALFSVAILLVVGVGIALKFRGPAPSGGKGTIRSLAVLPLKNLSSDPEQEYFSEGLTDELTTRLASLQGLRIISRTSAMQYKDSRKPLPAIAKELNVDAVVEGSVLRAGGRVRISVQLIEAAADRHIWAESYERDQRDILALQNEVTRDIAHNIKLSLDPAERQRLAASPPVDPEAHADYLRGRFYWSKRTAVDLRTAIGYFEQAIARDPNYANAYAGLADSYLLISGYSVAPRSESIRKARAAALRALEIDERLAEAHTSLALVAQNYDWDWQTAEKEYRRAIQLDPNYATAHHWHAECLALQGRFDEAFREIERARQLDPLSLIIAADNGVILYFSRQYDRAIEQFRAVLRREPNFPRAYVVIGAYERKGLLREALADVVNWELLDHTPFKPWIWAHRAYVYGRSGEQARAQHALEKLEELNRNWPMDPGPMILAYIGVDDKERAFAWLQEAYLEHSAAITGLKVDPLYDSLRADPRFQDLLRRIHLAQ